MFDMLQQQQNKFLVCIENVLGSKAFSDSDSALITSASILSFNFES